MSRINVDALHSEDSTAGSNIELDDSRNVTVKGNLSVDGTTTLTGAVELPDDTVDIADLSATGTASSSTYLRGDNSWATVTDTNTFGPGRILQVVSATTSTETSSTTTTYADSGLTKSITLASTDSKVLVLVNQAIGFVRGDNGLIGVGLKLMRDSTSLRVDPINPQMWKAKVGTGSGGEFSIGFHHTFVEIDSPSTAGSVTYKTQVAQDNAGTACAQNDSRQSWIVLAEIGG